MRTLRILTLFILTNIAGLAFCQEVVPGNRYLHPGMDYSLSGSIYDGDSSVFNQKPFSIRTTVGGSFSTFGKGHTLYSSYVSPTFGYQISGELSLIGGIRYEHGFSNSYFPTWNNDDGFDTYSGAFNRVTLYGGGKYKLTDNLSVSGILYKDIYDFPEMKALDNPLYNFDSEGMIMDFEYKLGGGAKFNAGFEIHRGQPYSPFHHPTYLQPGFYHPGSVFGDPF